MHNQTEINKAEKQARELRLALERHQGAANNKHQTHKQRENAKLRRAETEAKLQLTERYIAQLHESRVQLIQPAENFEKEYFSENHRGLSTNFIAQETAYLRERAVLELEHHRTINNAIHFREFAEKVDKNTPERVKRIELAEYWERRADNIERHLNKLLLNAPEPPGDENDKEGGVPPDPPEKTRHNAHTKPGNHIRGHRPKGKALQTTPDTKKDPEGS